jgi:transcriptional regulator with XRE-family HTH domain
MDLGERLKEERERLGLSQTAFGRIGGAGKTTVIAWERGDASPNAAFLAKAAEAGVNVVYVVTGSGEPDPAALLPEQERLLVAYFRKASADVRGAAMGALLGAVPKAGASLVFHAKVGGVVAGDVKNLTQGNRVTRRREKP